MSVRWSWLLTLGVLVAGPGCWTQEEAVAPVEADDRLNPLDKAVAEPWTQQVWFVADAGERVDALALTTDGDPHPIVALAKADGSRRVVVLDGPGQYHVSGTKLSVGGVTLTSGASPDGGWRAMINEGEHVQVTLTDKSGAGGRVVALRDHKTLKLAHPTVTVGGGAVVVAEVGDLGGIYRIALPDGPAVRIVPEHDVGAPAIWTVNGQDRVAYLEHTDVARVLVAIPPGDAPKPAVEALRAAGVPATLSAAVRTASGSILRPKPCKPVAPIATSAASDSVTVGTASSKQALPCGAGCLALLTQSPSGAPRILASIVGEGAAREVWFDPSLGLASGVYADPADPAAAELDACVPPLPPTTWLATTVAHPRPREAFLHMFSSSSSLNVFGADKARPLATVLMRADGGPLTRSLPKPVPPPDPIASTPDGSVHAAIDKGAVVWWSSRAEDDRVIVYDAAPDRAPVDVSFDDPGTLLFTDAGAHPGLYRLTLQKNEAELVLPWPKLRYPVRVQWDGEGVLGVVRDGSSAVVTRPLTAAERAAWDEGPITLARVEPSWSPVEDRDTGRVRCTSGDTVQIGVDGEGGFLIWGETRVAVRAAVLERGVLRVMADDLGVPSVVAELRENGDTAQWWPRGLHVDRVALAWMPTPAVAALPDGGACERRP